MSSTRVARLPGRRTRPRRRSGGLPRLLRRWRPRARRAWRRLKSTPLALRIAAGMVAVAVLLAAANLVYQVVRKPTEMFFPVAGVLHKKPAETWAEYAPLFRAHATAAITSELLAALAQTESNGNPVARTYWRWRFSWNPLEIYRPASSAVGMYQMTDAAFAEASRYCVHFHVVVDKGCWFNGLYTRVLPSHAIELTVVYLDRHVGMLLASRPSTAATPQLKQDLAAVIHLCGPGGARAIARRGFALASERCGDHDVARYVAKVNAMKREFLRLAAARS